MRILLTGASGFIGRQLMEALLRDGHHVVAVSRRAVPSNRTAVTWIAMDFSRAVQQADWKSAVSDADVVVNAVGIFTQTDTQTFDTIHRAAPCALFSAAVEA